MDHDISTAFATEDTCPFPQFKEPLLNFLLDEKATGSVNNLGTPCPLLPLPPFAMLKRLEHVLFSVRNASGLYNIERGKGVSSSEVSNVPRIIDRDCRFKGSTLIDKKDLQGLIGSNTLDEENYLSNYIVDEYLQVLVTEASSKGLKADTIRWETFEKIVSVNPANYVLKGTAPLLDQDIVLVPLNPGQSKHWSLLVYKPKERTIFVLDSLAAAFVKPCTKNAITKMWDLLLQIGANLEPEEWRFSTNIPQDIPQQSNNDDCGPFVCAYARCLLLKSSLPDDFTSFQKHVIPELHDGKI